MTISLVQSFTGVSPDTYPAQWSPSITTTAGNTLIACITLDKSYGDNAPITIDDGSGKQWVEAASSEDDNFTPRGAGQTYIFYRRGVDNETISTLSINQWAYAGAITLTLMEFEGIWYADPVDFVAATNSYTYSGLGNYTPSVPQITVSYNGSSPYRTSEDLQIVVCQSSASVSGVDVNNNFIPISGYNNAAVAWQADAYSVGAVFSGSVGDWTAALATFVPGQAGVNPNLQFPETLVLMNGASVNAYSTPSLARDQSPWVNITSYVRKMSLGPLGRQHELDRVQATQATITVDNRTGQFNPWNANSILNNCWSGLIPMAPVKVLASNNVNGPNATTPQFYGYLQSVTPNISDVLNVEADLAFVDYLSIMALKNISNDLYARTILQDNPVCYYRLGDPVGSINVLDSSGHGNNMLLVQNQYGMPAYGSAQAFLADANTSLDLTNGSKLSNGGITSINAEASPPQKIDPMGSKNQWSFEAWIQWNGGSDGTASQSYDFTASVSVGSSVSGLTADPYTLYAASTVGPYISEYQLLTGSGLPPFVYATNVQPNSGYTQITLSNSQTVSTSTSIKALESQYTLFSAVNVNTGAPFEIRVGATIDYNGVFGPTNSVNPQIYTGRVMVGQIASGTYSAEGQTFLAPDAISNADNLLDGNWHHVVVCYSHPYNLLEIYVDGQLSSSTNPSALDDFDFSYPVDIGIGAHLYNPSPHNRPIPGLPVNGFAGNMQDVALYGARLYDVQVEAHYEMGTWFASSETGDSRMRRLLYVIGADPASGDYIKPFFQVPYPFLTELYGETSTLTTTTALNYMQTITESEPGLIFQGKDGRLYAYNKQYQYHAWNGSGQPPNVTPPPNVFADGPVGLPYDGPSLQIVQDDLDVWNDIQVQSSRPANTANGQVAGVLQEWGPNQSTAASVSAQKYGPRTLQGMTSLQMLYDTDALAIAQNYAKWYNEPIVRVTQIVVSSAFDGGSEVPAMMNLNLMDPVAVQYNGQTSSTQFYSTYVIEQITHDITMDNGPEWKTTWALSPYEILMRPITLVDGYANGSSTFSPPNGLTSGQLIL